MIKQLLYFMLLVFGWGSAQIVHIPDANFKNQLLTNGGFGENNQYIEIDANDDGEIQYSEAQMVYHLTIAAAQISDLTGIEAFTNLTYLDCSNNQINYLDVSNLSNLQTLSCYENSLTSLDVSSLNNLINLRCNDNYLSSLNLEDLEDLEYLECRNNSLQSLNLTESINLIVLDAYNNDLTSLQIEGLVNLKILNVSGSYLENLNLSSLTNIEEIDCGQNNLTFLNVNNLTNLKKLNVSGNYNLAGNLQFNNLPNLEYFYAENIGAITLDVSHFGKLKSLYCGHSEDLVALNVNGLIELERLYIRRNNISEIDLSTNTNLKKLNCIESFSLRELDLSNNYYLEELEISEFMQQSELTYLNIKNGSNFLLVEDIYLKPDSCYICVDEGDGYFSYGETFTTTYCSYEPGGTINIITGTLLFDANNNGSCENGSDYPASFVKMNIVDGNNAEGNTIVNNSGIYNFYVQSGTFSLTPEVIENPNLFAVSPINSTVSFPVTNGSTQTRNFCITPNGNHSDVEIIISPLEPARPGFEATYKIVYRNKGNQTVLGNINFEFDDAHLDFNSSNPIPANQSTGLLHYDFAELHPFETREITLSFGVNAPTDTPPVNIDDILTFTAQITPTDGNPEDNTFELNQIVVGSYDPNDILCLEGTSVAPEMIGEELHYRIRFENTGTYPAERVVVAMPINPEEYDISSFQLLTTSHPVQARVVDDKAEFFFEDIQLQPNGQGDILFSIKSLNSLAVGDSVMSYADIYFDYNYPITTNEAETIFEILGLSESNPNVEVTIYPNPVKDILNIQSDSKIKSVELYDLTGKLIKVNLANSSEITQNFSGHPNGIYILKIYTQIGMSTHKIIKQ